MSREDGIGQVQAINGCDIFNASLLSFSSALSNLRQF